MNVLNLSNINATNKLLYAFAILVLLAVLGFVALEEILFLVIPAALLLTYLVINDVFAVYLIFFFTLPFSLEFYLPNGFGTDLPSEPLMLLLTAIAIVYTISNIAKNKPSLIKHPITLMLLIHVTWIFFTALYSEQSVVSIKFFLAKLWYVIPFYFLATAVINNQKKYLTLIRLLLLSLGLAIVVVLARHATVGFSFKEVHYAVKIFFRNHVNYACIIAAAVPFFLLWWKYDFKKGLLHKLKPVMLLGIIVALYLSYTRAAMISAFLVVPIYFVIKWRLMKLMFALTFAAGISLVAYLSFENRYLDLAPDYQKTITHYTFDNLIEATYKLEDISTMERVYRWVAGAHMVVEKPYMGFGPGNFYFFYKKYTVSSFKTYVSDNPEKSGMHNYYMMTVVEQGIIGLLIFLFLASFSLIYAETLYHKLVPSFDKDLLLSAIMMLCIILAINLMNDMLETAKQGPFFFWGLGIISVIGMKYRKNQSLVVT